MGRISISLFSILVLVLLACGLISFQSLAASDAALTSDSTSLVAPHPQEEKFNSEDSADSISKTAILGANGKGVGPANLLPVALSLTRVLLYIPTAAVFGAILFTLLVWDPSINHLKINSYSFLPYYDSIQKLYLASLVLLVAVDTLSLFTHTGQASGRLVGWPWQPEFKAVLLNTHQGAMLAARFGLALILAGLLLPRPDRWDRFVALGFCPLLLLTFSLEKYSVSTPLPTLPILNDWLHFASISLWVGGLIAFFIAMWTINRLTPHHRTYLTSLLIPRFSMLAIGSVVFMTFTGVYAIASHLDPITTFIDTAYGRVLLLKILVIVPMIALGGFHILMTSPLMMHAAHKPNGNLRLVKLFRQLLTAEMLLGLLFLALAGIHTTQPAPLAAATTSEYEKTTRVDDLKVALTVDPGRVGMNSFTARVTANNQPVTDAQNVFIEFDALSGLVVYTRSAMLNLGDGIYSLQSGSLSRADRWDVKVVVQRIDRLDASARFAVPIGEQTYHPVSWQPFIIALYGVVAISFIFFVWRVIRKSDPAWNYPEIA